MKAPAPRPTLPPKPSTPALTSFRALLGMAVVATAGAASPALAADPAPDNAGTRVAQASPSPSTVSPSSQTGPSQPTPPVAGGGAGGGSASDYTVRLTPPGQNPYALADQLKIRGWTIPLPGAADTLDGGLFGARNALAEKGISWLGFSTTTFQDNVLHHGHPPGVNNQLPGNSKQEQYNGQLPTFNSSNAFFVNYDLRRYGIPDGQITVGGFLVSNNWNPSGPNGFGIAQASYYQTLFDKRVEIKIGLLENNLEFLGTQIGGNLAGGIFGVNAAIPVENGQSLPSIAEPGVNVKLNLPGNFYDKVGLQRSISPGGPLVERLQNPSGVARFTVPNAGLLVFNEAGYRVNAAPGQMSTWIRGAADYNSSHYSDFTTGHLHGTNFGLYLLADRQLIQTAPNAAPGSAIRGIYAGFSVMYAPSYFNAFSQYYEARLYGFGLIPGRPFDLVTLVANRNVFSEDAVRRARAFRQLTHDNANTYTAAYSAKVAPGTNINVGVSYVDNPTPIVYRGNTGSALNVISNLFVFF